MKYILIAEDDPGISDVLTQAICDNLYVATHVIPNGALVLEALTERRPDLLVLDVGLPGLSGLDIFDLVRSDERFHGMPVLFLTGDPEKAATAFSPAGHHRVMEKPFKLDELLATVDQLIELPARATAA